MGQPASPIVGSVQCLRSIVQRIGDILFHSQSLASAVFLPVQCLGFLTDPTPSSPVDPLCTDPRSVLFYLDNAEFINQTHIAAYLQAVLSPYPALIQPSPTPPSLRLLAWKLESPPRTILYTSPDPPPPSLLDPLVLEPHTFQKTLVEQRSKRPCPVSIHLLPPANSMPISDCIRASLMHYAQTKLTPYKEHIDGQIAQAHTLEEAIACFIYPPRDHHTEIPVNASLTWNKSHIDSRSRPPSLALPPSLSPPNPREETNNYSSK